MVDALDERLLGTDIRLLGDLETAEHRLRGTDLVTYPRPASSLTDLQPLSGLADLQQALLLRFLTEVGELAHLGHPTYGSRLHELVGEPNTETTRNRAKLFALQALQDEPRVERVLSLSVTNLPPTSALASTTGRFRDRIFVNATLRVLRVPNPVNLVFPIPLDGGAP
jgi:phage baseplate assembly protein W